MVALSLAGMGFKQANEAVRAALGSSDSLELHDVRAQRYLGCALGERASLEIFGTPGNDMGCFLAGGRIEVHGSAQDQVGNTMGGGLIAIHGRCGDAAGYAMRGGRIFVRDGCGWRVGINMKEYGDTVPAIVVGGDAGCFLGEYMAGGCIVLLGRAGAHIASGMHGGSIFLAHPLERSLVPEGIIQRSVDAAEARHLCGLLEEYAGLFPEKDIVSAGLNIFDLASSFAVLRPKSSRPYEGMYSG